MIPVVLGWMALGIGSSQNASPGGGVFAILALGGYGLAVIGAIVCLFVERVRSIGYGLLTMIFVGPIVWGMGCIVILSAS
jgi:hypothetical protein